MSKWLAIAGLGALGVWFVVKSRSASASLRNGEDSLSNQPTEPEETIYNQTLPGYRPTVWVPSGGVKRAPLPQQVSKEDVLESDSGLVTLYTKVDQPYLADKVSIRTGGVGTKTVLRPEPRVGEALDALQSSNVGIYAR